jgi:crossover junction endodeoxyribonuclease RuvC
MSKTLSPRTAKIIAGVDPGLAGALFLLDPHSPTTGQAIDMPVHLLARGGRKKYEFDIAGLVGIVTSQPLDHAFVEQVASMPGQGVSSTFAFGKSFGAVLGVLAACRIPTTLISPISWKRALGVPKAKDAARARASQLLPEAAFQWALAKQHGRAEAALLALYGLRRLNQKGE